MSETYTVYWTKRRCRALRKLGDVGKPLDVLFGGPHVSEPRFRRATVQPGDEVYPISLRAGVLYVLGRVRVRRILALDDYVAAHPELFAPYLEPPAELSGQSGGGLIRRCVRPVEAFERYRQAQPEMRYLAPTCTDEAVECEEGTPVRLDLAVPAEMLPRLRYRSRRKECDLHKFLRDGRLMHCLGVWGIYRLSEASADEFATLVDGTSVGSPR